MLRLVLTRPTWPKIVITSVSALAAVGIVVAPAAALRATPSAPFARTLLSTAQHARVTTFHAALAHPRVPRLVGRWSRVRTCQELVDALTKAGLRAAAPAAVGDFFPGSTPQQLAQKTNLCDGAAPQVHSHFFTKAGRFGSLDQNGRQVDDGRFQIKGHALRINSGTFRYRIRNGIRLRRSHRFLPAELSLTPVITAATRRQALVHPLKFSVATWMVAVAYTGHTWNRVPCNGWC
jgi:hypothetical protein